MSKFARQRLAPLTFVAGLLLGGIVAVTVAAEASSSPPTYYACLDKGLLTHVSTKAHTCSFGKRVSWNAVGPQGAPGLMGAQGAQGSSGQRGVQGATGSRGPQGATGAAGAAGPGAAYFTSSGSYVVPLGVTAVRILAVGGGGGGGGVIDFPSAGGGGGQGATELFVATVSPGDNLTVTVGFAGLSVLGVGIAGGSSVVEDGSNEIAFSAGGSGGSEDSTGGVGGQAAALAGVTTVSAISGANGANGTGAGGAGGGVPGVAGSGGAGGAEADPGVSYGANGTAGYVEIIPN